MLKLYCEKFVNKEACFESLFCFQAIRTHNPDRQSYQMAGLFYDHKTFTGPDKTKTTVGPFLVVKEDFYGKQ